MTAPLKPKRPSSRSTAGKRAAAAGRLDASVQPSLFGAGTGASKIGDEDGSRAGEMPPSPSPSAPRTPGRAASSAVKAAMKASAVKTSVAGASEGPDLRAWVDGGSRGNPGPAGYGAYIEDAKGNLVGELSGYLGMTTNNVAEYGGLLAALRAAHEMGARSLLVHADSELVVKQMNGQYKVKNEKLKPLFLQARALAARLPKFAIHHVRREQNRDADRLANEAMDRGE